MKIYDRFLKTLLALGLVLSFTATLTFPAIVLADDPMDCGRVKTSVIDCATLGGSPGGEDTDGSHIFGLILIGIDIMTAGIGIVAVGGLVYGGLLYTSASDNQAQVQKAVGVIKNVVIGLIGYFALFAFVQYLIPGGVFS